MATQNKIFVQIDNEKIELTGDALDAFLADRQALADQKAAAELAAEAKATAKAALLDRLGITEDEARLLLS